MQPNLEPLWANVVVLQMSATGFSTIFHNGKSQACTAGMRGGGTAPKEGFTQQRQILFRNSGAPVPYGDDSFSLPCLRPDMHGTIASRIMQGVSQQITEEPLQIIPV